MAADTMGMFRAMSLVSRVAVETWLGTTSERPGSSKTSSKVSPSRISIGVSVLRRGYHPGLPGSQPPPREVAADGVARYLSQMNAPASKPSKYKRYRDRMKARGLKELRMWVIDPDAPGFQAKLDAEIARINASASNREALDFIEAARRFQRLDLGRRSGPAA
ncbi:MAG: antitoxin MazE-like protein, partial [Caulobacteraceae bacterium]